MTIADFWLIWYYPKEWSCLFAPYSCTTTFHNYCDFPWPTLAGNVNAPPPTFSIASLDFLQHIAQYELPGKSDGWNFASQKWDCFFMYQNGLYCRATRAVSLDKKCRTQEISREKAISSGFQWNLLENKTIFVKWKVCENYRQCSDLPPVTEAPIGSFGARDQNFKGPVRNWAMESAIL